MIARNSSAGADRRGAVAVLVAISLTAIVIAMAIALDGGLLYAERRHAQATADAAALAGAADLFKNYGKNSGNDPSPYSAKTSALTIANLNGYTNDGTTTVVDVRTYGAKYAGGANAGKDIPQGYVEVNVTYNYPRYFSSIISSGTIAIKARAVAQGTYTPVKFGLLTLSPSGTGLSIGGNGSVNVGSGVVQVDSSAGSAVSVGKNGVLKAKELDILGGISNSGTLLDSNGNPLTPKTSVPASPDPLASLPAPTKPAAGTITKLTGKSASNMLASLVSAGVLTQTWVNNNSNVKVYSATSGSYDNMQSFTNNDLVVFQSGIYYLNSGGFKSNNASLVMDPSTSGGMMFYNNGTGSNDKFSMAGSSGGVVNLTGMTSGPYQGMIFFQNRAATEDVSITGNGTFNVNGTVYAPNAAISLAGNGSTQVVAAAVIANTVSVTGNGAVNISFSSGAVTPQRLVRLVE